MTLYELTAKLVINKGWSVIPVDPNTKHPTIKWKEYQTRLPEIDELKEWFDGKTPKDVSVGLVTGKISDVIVLDSDDGQEFPFGLHSDMKVKTGRGYHLYFKYVEGIRNTVKIKGKEVDIRGEGGYVIIPPSIHKNGSKYIWVNKGEPSELPEEIVALQVDPKQPFDWQTAFRAISGSRNDTLYKGACSLFAKGFKKQEVYGFMKAMNNDWGSPLKEGEVLATLESASKHEKKSKIASPRKISSLNEKWLEMKSEEKKAPSTGFPCLDLIINGFIPRHLYTLTAETNSGKTQLAVNFAVALAEQKKKVAFIALEPDINIITGIKACIANTSYNEAPIDITTDYIDIFLQEDIPDFETLQETMNSLASEYALIIVDHIGYFASGEDITASQSHLLKKLAILSKTARSAFLIIAHPKKRNKKGAITMNDISGSAAFKQDSTEVLILNREKLNPEDPYDERMSNLAYLVVAKKKVTNNSKDTYVKLEFSDETVKIKDILAEDNSELVEEFI